MTTHPGTAAEFADSNKCICCKRSKSGGSFFEVEAVSDYFSATGFEFGHWEADIDVFREASRQGCQRCAVAYDMVTTWKKNNPQNDSRHISVRNSIKLPHMLAAVCVHLWESGEAYWFDETTVRLELLSSNRRCPKRNSYTLCGYLKTDRLKT